MKAVLSALTAVCTLFAAVLSRADLPDLVPVDFQVAATVAAKAAPPYGVGFERLVVGKTQPCRSSFGSSTGPGLPSKPEVVAARTGCLCPEMAAKFSAILECDQGLI